MKPHVICLMASSVDGRTLHSRWRPKGSGADLFERVHDELASDGWLVGRVTGQEFAKGQPYPASTNESFPREPWFARRDAKAYGVVLDTHGKIGWGRSDIGGDPIIVVLSEAVRMRTWRGCAARACPTSLPEGRSSISPSRWRSSVASSA
jgi:riboflavin biosynthesis pyrimidine reductase